MAVKIQPVMKAGALGTVGEPITLAAARPRVVVSFSDYSPPFDVSSLVEQMIESVPPRYLLGLREVVLTNKIGLSRSRRRSVTKSRGRKVKVLQARGLYHPTWKGKQAWIEVFVDSTLSGYEKGWSRWLLVFGYFRENEIGRVLFHEIGHHIDATHRPEFREKEDIADDWSTRLMRAWLRRERPLLRRMLRLFIPILRVIVGMLAEKLLARGEWTRARYESYMKKIRSYK
jgi:hypothetical protein